MAFHVLEGSGVLLTCCAVLMAILSALHKDVLPRLPSRLPYRQLLSPPLLHLHLTRGPLA